MIVGIDMGGTHIDGVIIKENQILKSVKNPVDRSDLHSTVLKAIKELTSDINKGEISRIHLSTTVSTNAIVEGTTTPVHLILQEGPGIIGDFTDLTEDIDKISGYVDHRGILKQDLDYKELRSINIKISSNLAIVTKFSTRNPQMENELKDYFKNIDGYTTLGHKVSGRLNYPRRVNTAYLNSSVYDVYNDFIDNIITSLKKLKIDAPVYVLKADGGTMDITTSKILPVETILSGPAASYMGMTSLTKNHNDSLLLDIGGTTTDIFFTVNGSPLFEPKGINIDNIPTSVRAIYSHSIGLGGDSYIRYEDGQIKIGPERKDFAIAYGGEYLTLTDGVLYLENSGNNLDKIKSELSKIGKHTDQSPREVAQSIVTKAMTILKDRVETLIEEFYSRPVFTVESVLSREKIKPTEIKIIGGPSEILAPYIEKTLGLETTVPPYYNIANAIGSGLSKPTIEANLLADTNRGILSIPELGIYRKIPRDFDLTDGEQLVIDLLETWAFDLNIPDPEIEIIDKESFNMIQGYSVSKNIRIHGQIKPGLIQGGIYES